MMPNNQAVDQFMNSEDTIWMYKEGELIFRSKKERLADSLVGKGCRITKQEGNVSPKRLFVGDDVNIEL